MEILSYVIKRENILFIILVTLLLAYLFSELFKYFKLPRVVGQIIAGILIGVFDAKFRIFTPDTRSFFDFLTNIGIILLFFFVGLEIDLKRFRKNIKESAMISLFNTFFPLAFGFLISRVIFQLDNISSLVVGIALAVSSQAISLDILEESKLLKTKLGNLIMTTGAVDDIFELFAISVILIIFNVSLEGGTSLRQFYFSILIFVVAITILRYSLIPLTLKMFNRDKSRDVLFMGGLIIVLFMAYLSDILGISSFVGSLVAGIMVRQTLINVEHHKPWTRNELSHSIHILSFGFLIPLFFVNVGLKTSLESITQNFGMAMAFLAIDLAGTIFGTLVGVAFSGGTVQEGLIVGWAVTPKGDTELVIATIALAGNLINQNVYSAIVTVALLSTLISPIAFKFLIKRYKHRLTAIQKG